MEMVEEGQNQPKIYPKRIKFKEIEDKGEVDRVSALPDCLLVEILSRLPRTEYAIRTGTLSKRWKHLWTSIPTLTFTGGYYSSPSTDFFTFVDKTLAQRPQSKLKKFEVNTSYHIQYESEVNNWIRYAMGCNVEELILKLELASGTECQLDRIFYISSYFTDLTLEGFFLNPTGAISWKNLRSLSICNGKLDEAVIENILSGTPQLETLELDHCYGYRLLNITSKSVKKLVFNGYYDPEHEYYDLDEIIKINAPDILSITIEYDLLLWKLLLLNVTSLIEAKLDYWNHEIMSKKVEEEMLKGFIVNLCHVKDLKIGDSCSKVLSRLVAKGFDLPSNIKFLDGAYELIQQGDSSESESESESDEDN